jgi:hypothetical protein
MRVTGSEIPISAIGISVILVVRFKSGKDEAVRFKSEKTEVVNSKSS